MQFEVTILGSNAAIPAYNRYPSAQIVNYNGNLFLVDCGEGTQFRMNVFGIKRARLDNIFISHLHGDHYFGLIGLLTSFNLNWREHPLNIYGPTGLEEIMKIHFKHSKTILKYEITFHDITADKPVKIYEDQVLTVETVIMSHRLPTTGFLFREKPGLRKIIPEKIEQYKIPYEKIPAIKKGEDYVDASGKRLLNSEITLPPHPPRSYVYCSDTIYTENFLKQIQGVNMLYHEATFVDADLKRAQETFHTTTKQAAEIARLAKVGKLLIGHFSARYENLQLLLKESKEVFTETYLAEEGKTFPVESIAAQTR